MKIFNLILLLSLSGALVAQTKTSTTTTKKPVTTTATKKPVTTAKKPTTTTTKTSTTTTKPATTVTNASTPTAAPAPAASPAVEPAPVQQTPTGPPATGKVSGPKSYETTTAAPATSSKSNKTAKAAAPKEKVQKASTGWAKSYFGIHGGYNLSKISEFAKLAEAGQTEAFQPGYMGGIALQMGLGNTVAIQPEINYMQVGARAEIGDTYGSIILSKVDVPILLKLGFGNGPVRFFVNAGPYIGYKLKQQTETNFGGTVEKEDQEFVTEYDSDGIKDNMLDFGAVGGAGFMFKIGKPVISLEGRYQYGFADPQLYKNGIPAELSGSGRVRTITGKIGLLFPMGN